MRLDQYLFRARHFKSRSQASNACKEGRIHVQGAAAKSSTEVHANDCIQIREKGLYRTIRILELPGKNISKDLAKTTWTDETPADIVQQRELIQAASRVRVYREASGRPTKRDRRQLDKLRGR